MRKLKENWPFLVLILLTLLTRFWNLSSPSEVVFDEVHFGKFIAAYSSHEYYFDIHPPLGKMIIAGFSYLMGVRPDFDFAKIGEPFDGHSLFILRFLPAFFGVISVLAIYLLIRAFGCSKNVAFLGGLMMLFDNAFLAESKFILMDMILLNFGLLALFFFLISRKSSVRKRFLLILFSALFAGLAASIKWTGLTFLAIIGFFTFIDFWKDLNWKKFLLSGAVLIVIPVLVYIAPFAIHFKLLQKSGPGDAFMSPAFQQELIGNSTKAKTAPLSFFGKFIELNKAMYKASATLTATHPDASRWYQWPFGKKPIWYWTKSNDINTVSNIHLFGNPLVWWPVLISVIFSVFALATKRIASIRKNPEKKYALSLLIFGYLVNLLPYISINRVTFLYHYLPALALGIIIFAILIDLVLNPKGEKIKQYKIKKLREKEKIANQEQEFKGFRSLGYFTLYSLYLTALVLAFLLLAPLTYGSALATQHNQWLMIFIKLVS